MLTDKKKKLNLKKCEYVHLLQNGNLKLFYKEKHKVSGQTISWCEEVEKDNVPFKHFVSGSKEFAYKSLMFDKSLVPLLNDFDKIEIWPKNNSDQATYGLKSVIVNLKNGAYVSFNFYVIDGKNYSPYQVSIVY